eukprot:2919994-Amphidinium_carterae.1
MDQGSCKNGSYFSSLVFRVCVADQIFAACLCSMHKVLWIAPQGCVYYPVYEVLHYIPKVGTSKASGQCGLVGEDSPMYPIPRLIAFRCKFWATRVACKRRALAGLPFGTKSYTRQKTSVCRRVAWGSEVTSLRLAGSYEEPRADLLCKRACSC